MKAIVFLLRWSVKGMKSGIRAGETGSPLRRLVLGGLLLTVSALVFSSGAGAAEEQWKYFGTNKNGDRFFYDASSVMYLSADLIQVWTRELTSEGAAKRLKEINCSYKIIRELQVIYEGKQKPRFRSHALLDWRAMEQDPITLELYKDLCR
jgi:hypothetical protein